MPGNNPVPLHTVLFDLDATLADSQPIYLQAYNEVFRAFLGRDLDLEERIRYMGVPTREFMGRYTSGSQLDDMASALQIHVLRLMVNVQLFPGLREVLPVLVNSGFRLGVVTSQTRAECEVTRKYLCIDPWIQTWVTVNDVTLPKPHAEPIMECLERMSAGPEQSIMVGDSIYDLQAGYAAGVRVGAALWGAIDSPSLLELKPNYVFSTPTDLIELIEMIPEN